MHVGRLWKLLWDLEMVDGSYVGRYEVGRSKSGMEPVFYSWLLG